MNPVAFEIDIGFSGVPMTEATADAVLDEIARTPGVVDRLATRRAPDVDEIDAYALLEVDDLKVVTKVAEDIASRSIKVLSLLLPRPVLVEIAIRRVLDEESSVEHESVSARTRRPTAGQPPEEECTLYGRRPTTLSEHTPCSSGTLGGRGEVAFVSD